MEVSRCCPCPFGHGRRHSSRTLRGRYKNAGRRLGCFCGNYCTVWLYLSLLWWFQRSYFWSWTWEWEAKCQYDPLPVNQTGLKVLVAGHAKTGTWAITKHLHSIYNNTYHGQEFIYHIWNPIAVDYWKRPENGGRKPTIHHPLKMQYYADMEFQRTGNKVVPDILRFTQNETVTGQSEEERFPYDDLLVLKNLSREKLAEHVSRCRTDSIALDGTESLFFPLLDVSPNVKVIMLDWRPYNSWKLSVEKFGFRWITLTWTTNLLYSGLHGLPYGFLVKRADPLLGGPIDEMMRTGEAFLHLEYAPMHQLWCTLDYQRLIYSHWWGGLMEAMIPKEDYDGFYKEVARRTPPENLLRWDFKKNTWEDLCAFLGVEECPETGELEHAKNVNSWEKVPFEEIMEPMMLTPLFLFCHWVNWRVYGAILSAIFRAVRFLLWLTCCRGFGGRWKLKAA